MLKKSEMTYYAAKDTIVTLQTEEKYQHENIYNKLWTDE